MHFSKMFIVEILLSIITITLLIFLLSKKDKCCPMQKIQKPQKSKDNFCKGQCFNDYILCPEQQGESDEMCTQWYNDCVTQCNK